MLKRIRTILLDLVFPLTCVGCGSHDTLLCNACQELLKRSTLHYYANPAPHLDYLIACGTYQNPLLTTLVKSLKYQGIIEASSLLGQLAVQAMHKMQIPRATVLVPIPLHKRKCRMRGFNQSELIAREIAITTSNALDTALIRARYTPSQSRLGRDERLKNVVSAFNYPLSRAPQEVLLLDDVATTVATLDAASAALKQKGAARVGGLVIARGA